MTIETTILKLLKYRSRCDRLYKAVPQKVLDIRTLTILNDFVAYFKEFPDVDRIPHEDFFLWFKMYRHPTLSDDQLKLYETVLKNIQEDVSPAIEAGMMARLVAAELAYDMSVTLQQWHEGQEVDLYHAMRGQVEAYEQATDRKVKIPWVQDKIGDLLKAEENDVGLHWRLDCLNQSTRPLRGGDFILVAGRPDKGKTTFLTSELTHMAPQIASLYPGEKRSIIWFNNEGPGKRILQRAYQSALNMTIPELVEAHNKPSTNGHEHLLDEMYSKAMGGSLDIIKIMDVHDFWSHELEDILRNEPAALVVWDMIDNVKFSGRGSNGGERTDQLLEAMYQWVRVLCVKFDIPMIATSQISAEGDGMTYPTLGMLKDSKTGKQGAAEAIITLGASNDIVMAGSRFIGMTKNKIHRYGGPKDPRCEVHFDSERGRYNMPSML